MADVNECFKVMWFKGTEYLPETVVEDLAQAAGSDGELCYDEYVKIDEKVAPFLDEFLKTPERRFNNLVDTAGICESDASDNSEFEAARKHLEKGDFKAAAAAAADIEESELRLRAFEIVGEELSALETRSISESISGIADEIEMSDLEEIFSVLAREMLENGRRIDVRDVASALPTAEIRDAWRNELILEFMMNYMEYDEARRIAAGIEDEALRESQMEQIDRRQERRAREKD